MREEEVRKLAEEHWAWVEPLLLPHYGSLAVATMKYLYITAMVHGYKHGQEVKQ